ncbi:hypothetical protein BDF21DRAFT_423851 [Thamnidium elegans]|nr:hypothetical protein BDF21DRAFT_423851 [Thamnidium elegans]
MGLPLWKPRDIEQEQQQHEEYIKHQEDIDEDSWSIFPHQLVQNVYNNNNNNRRPSTSRHPVNNNPRHLTPVSSSIPTATSSQLRRSRITRRHSMLTSSLMDRRRSSRVHQLPGPTTSTSPPVRSELDRRLQQRINEKEDLLEQLQVTVSLLDEFLTARADLGSNFMSLPAFITEDLPAVLQSAASLAAMAPSVLSSFIPPTQNTTNEVTTLHEMVDRLLQIPPYSTRIHNVETNIISAHRRIREQLSLLGTSSIPSPIIRPSLENRPSLLDYHQESNSSL